jgi:hypothetical protein
MQSPPTKREMAQARLRARLSRKRAVSPHHGRGKRTRLDFLTSTTRIRIVTVCSCGLIAIFFGYPGDEVLAAAIMTLMISWFVDLMLLPVDPKEL